MAAVIETIGHDTQWGESDGDRSPRLFGGLLAVIAKAPVSGRRYIPDGLNLPPKD